MDCVTGFVLNNVTDLIVYRGLITVNHDHEVKLMFFLLWLHILTLHFYIFHNERQTLTFSTAET